MRQGTRKGLLTMAAATGVIAAASGYAHADSGASGSAAGSPGVLSGNTVQAPVHVPVNVCGNTVSVIGLLNPSAGNKCADQGGGSSPGGHTGSGGHGGSHAGGHTTGSPGVGSGNTVQVPVDVPVNVCGNSVDIIGIGNSAVGNECANGGGHEGGGRHTPPPATPGNPGHPGSPQQPGTPAQPSAPATPPGTGVHTGGSSGTGQQNAGYVTQPRAGAQLAHTGADLPIGLVLPVGAGALLAGAVLYRKARASA